MPNRLARETSPYLQQHADNPVDWYPWGDEAFARARAEDKPVLLSVGYSACHWCHVMAHESFEDEATAKVMNELFINIKVDREERPDVDGIYMQAVQAFSQGHGGWPMTVFMTPDGRPFFGGTYYPPQPRQGMPSFTQVMRHIESIWANRRDEVHEVGEQLREILTPRPSSPEAAGPHWLDDVVDSALQVLDPIHGGFGTAPKFPPHGTLPALLVQAWRTRDPRVVDALRGTLDGMARGGTYDHLRGGFARYSVDAEWRIPHFEKMLYDNGQLLHTYTSAWQLTKAPHYARIVAETVGWLREEMTLDGGAFAAALDADSEGEEGRFYVWTPDQLREVLGDAAERVAKLCQVTSEGTFEHGASVLRLEEPVEALPLADQALLERSFPKLLAARDTRVAPGRDDKIIVAWNALVIGALARAGAAFDQPTWIDDAVRAWDFLARHLVVDERWQRTFKDGRAHVPAMADDHANLLDAALHLYEATFDPAWLDRAEALADTLLALFWDDEHGGLFETGADAEALLVRPKKLDGGSEPAANGTAALGFAKLAVFRGRDDLGERADTMLANYAPLLKQAARVVGTEALAALWRSGAVRELAIVGPPDQTAPLARVVRERFQPVTAVACAPESATTGIPWLAQRTAGPSALAYLCAHGACQLPVDSPEALAEQLDAVAISVLADTRRSKVRVRAPELPSDPALWLNTDAPLQLAALEGQVVVLDFWTHCCINCHHVLPALAAIEERFADAPVAVIGVHSAKFPAEKELQHVQSAIERQRVAHPVVNDAEHTLWDAYAVRSWPTIVIIDSTGRVAWQKGGEVSAETLSVEVERLLAEGRADGTLADGPVWSPPLRPTATPELAFPGKASVWPTPIHQQNGAEPFGPDSRLYISDTGNDRILEATLVCGPDGWPRADVVRRWGLIPGLVDGKGLQARFHMPQGLRRAGDTLWVADTENHAIRAIHLPTGIVRTAAGTGSLGRGGRITVDQPTRVALRSPWDVAPAIQTLDGEATAVFIAMAGTHQIWVHNPGDDDLGPLAGSGRENHIDGALPEAALAQPSGLALYGSSLFFADSEVSSIRVVDLQEGQVGTLVGQGLFDFGDVDGAPDQALLQHPLGLATDGETVWVADTYNGKIKAIDLSTGHIRTLCDGLTDPGSVDVAGEFLIVADTGAHRLVAVHTLTGECRQVYLTGL